MIFRTLSLFFGSSAFITSCGLLPLPFLSFGLYCGMTAPYRMMFA